MTMSDNQTQEQEWQLPKTTIPLMCPTPDCGRRLCRNCRRAKWATHHHGFCTTVGCCVTREDAARPSWGDPDIESLQDTFVWCCQCKQSSAVKYWLGVQREHQQKPRTTMSRNEFELERIALESQVARGLTPQTELEDWLRRWTQQANGRYLSDEEMLKRLAGEPEGEAD
jgi:hypothetical protein